MVTDDKKIKKIQQKDIKPLYTGNWTQAKKTSPANF